MAEWVRASRLRGVLRYHWKRLGGLILWTLIIVLGVQLLSLLMPFVSTEAYPFEGIRGNLEIVIMAALVAGLITAGRSSRFLLRFGTSRTAVWIGNELGLFAGMVGLLLGTFVLNMLVGALLFPLAHVLPDDYAITGSQYAAELREGLQNLPSQLLYALEWTSIFYFYACMMRRYKAFTLSLTIGVPLLFIILMLIPAVREAVSVVESDNQGQIMLLGLRWMQILQNVLRFLDEHWDAVQLTAGVACLPLSYLVMRGTKQP